MPCFPADRMVFLLSALLIVNSAADEFFVGDRDVTVTNATISPDGLSQGDRVTFSGDIQTSGIGVQIQPVPGDLTLTFDSDSSVNVLGMGISAIVLEGAFDGDMLHEGVVRGPFSGITFARSFSGSLRNRGTVSADHFGVLFGMGDFSGKFSNAGTIRGGEDGIHVMSSFSGELVNTGVIEGIDGYGINLAELPLGAFFSRGAGGGLLIPGALSPGPPQGTIRNDGGKIIGGEKAVNLGFGDGKMILSGPSRIDGAIDGGAGDDTLRFERMRGISPGKKAELKRIAEENPESGSISLFGEIIAWENFESIEAQLSTLTSYENLITAPGLNGFARALDNPKGLDDELRNFLNALNNVDAEALNAVTANLSGQTMISALDQFGREQDSRLYSLFGNQFSSLRGSVSGRENGVSRNDLFTSEVPAGGAWDVPDRDANIFVSGFVGSGDQDPSLNRADAEFDATAVVFGVGRQISDHWNLGVFGGYGRNEARVDQFGSELETRSAYAGFTAQYVNGSFFTNLVAGYGYLESDSDRRDFLGNRMTGDRNGHQGLFYFQSGWDFAFGEKEKGRVTPYFGMALSATELDGFSESGPATASLRFQDESMISVQTVLGVNVIGHHDTGAGWIKPRLNLAWWQVLDGAESSHVSLVQPGLLNPFTVSTEDADESRAVLQLGADFSFDAMPNWIFNAGYFGSYGDDGYSSHGGMIGVRIDF